MAILDMFLVLLCLSLQDLVSAFFPRRGDFWLGMTGGPKWLPT